MNYEKKLFIYYSLINCIYPGFLQDRKSYVRPDLNLPDSLAQHQDTLSFGDREWWQIYTDSTLRSLIDRALEHNKDMLIAAARVKEMAAQKRISTANLLPDIKGTVTAERENETMVEMLSNVAILSRRNFFSPGNSTSGEIFVGHVPPALPSIFSPLRHNALFG